MKKTVIILLPIFWPNLPPLSLVSLKGFINKYNIPIDIIDFNNYFFDLVSNDLKKKWIISCNQSLEAGILDILKTQYGDLYNDMIDRLLKYDIVGFSCYKSNYEVSKEIAQILRNIDPRIETIFGGPEITRQYFKLHDALSKEPGNSADFIVAGEGELPLLDYLTDRRLNSNVSAFWELNDLTELPAPDYTGIDFSKYHKKNSVSLMYNRGCIRACKFCSERLLYKKFKRGSADSIIAQIKHHKSNGISQFIFHDSIINADYNALEELCDKIISNFGNIKWEAQIAVRSDMPEKLFAKMKNSGCYNLFIGLESGSNRTLSAMNKGFSTAEAIYFFRKLNTAGLHFGISIIAGYPGETQQDFIDSVDFVINNKSIIPKIVQINPYIYYEGTEPVKQHDYISPAESMQRAAEFINRIKEAGFKYTNAFLMNLVEK